jgi:hypothetical protein
MTRRLAAAFASALLAFLFATALSAQSTPRRSSAAAPALVPAPTIPASIAIKAAFAALDESISCDRPETLYLTVTNEGTADLLVRRVTLRAPSDLQLCPPPGGRQPPPDPTARFSRLGLGTPVAAGRRAVIALPVGTRATPRPGTVPLLVEVELAATIGGAVHADTLLASDQVELRIPGLSDVLRLFGVPTLFLLPGVLVFAAFAAGRSGWDWDRLTAPASATFWALAIMVSIILSSLYAWVAHGFGFARDLSERFNLTDVGIVWFISLLLGLGFGYFVRGREARAAGAAAAATKQATAAQTVRREDQPLGLLKKLARLETAWPPLWHDSGGNAGFLVEPGGGQRRWLLPQAEAKARPSTITKADWNVLSAEFDTRIGDQSSLAAIIAALDDPKFGALLPLGWRAAAAPHELDDDAEPTLGDDRRFIFREA